MKYLLLSTYPIDSSRNSGDDLIGKSLIKLLKDLKGQNVKVDTRYIAKTNSTEDLKQNYKAILAPAMKLRVSNGKVAPRYRNEYMEFALQYNIPVYAIGAGWNHYPGTFSQSENVELAQPEIELFNKLFNKENAVKSRISCRDIYTENILKNHHISCFGTTGDPGLFDTDYIGRAPNLPQRINTIAVSLPHNRHNFDKAYEIALNLKKKYSCQVKLVLHGYRGKLYSRLLQKWSNTPIEIIDASGRAEKLEFYNDIDLHVGFRLHAHIWFLRTRKPSLLIAEDGRSTGHLATINGLGYMAAPKFAIILAQLLPELANECRLELHKQPPSDDVYNLLEKEMESGYEVTKNSLKIVDQLWEEKMKSFLNLIPD
ncbi:polysaccharide pyruvyl transferase family protein [Gracilibacillus sp. D59]|uniref:polysaccharide pyruvyl transferase family protein n=1 Tax=Gracilibacillus sp. D59 TaxID=3457434 RepID=UPI003FCD54AB